PLSFAQVPAAQVPIPDPRSPTAVITTPSGKKMVAFAGKPTPLFWADDIRQINQLDDYKRTGLNTVVVRLTWRAGAGGELTPTGFDEPRAFAQAAAARGLHVIYALPPAPDGMEASFRIAADSNPYFLIWTGWVTSAVAALKDTTNLAGWMLPDDPRSLSFANDAGFNRWLKANYADVGVINEQWKTGFRSFEDITLEAAESVIASWQDLLPQEGNMTRDELLSRYEEMNQRANRLPVERNFAFHPAALALAHYKWDAYRALLDAWAGVARGADPEHLIFSGRLPDYAQLLSLPASIDVSLPGVQPGLAETDVVTHNPQAVDIARRGGRFAAIPVLSTTGVASADALPSLLPSWADAALAHGASGLAFASWNDLRQNAGLRRAVMVNLERLQSPAFQDLWSQTPVATAAVVLTPLADGHTLQTGLSGQPGEARGLYGFGENLISGEPSDLVYAFRWGTAFGSIDFLSPDEFGGDTDQLLNHYSILLLPQALSIPESMAQSLTRYVAEGGIIVADLGAGAAQAGGQVVGLSPTLSALFGVASPLELKNFAFNLQSMIPHPLLPTWQGVTGGRTGVQLTSGDGPGGTAFSGPVGFGLLLPGTVPLALAKEIPQRLGDPARGNVVTRLQRAQLTAKPLGTGFAVFAPFRLWNFWRPGHLGFDAFHGDLFSRGAAVVQLGMNSLVPLPMAAPLPANTDATLYPEIVNFPQSVALLNHNAMLMNPAARGPDNPGGGVQFATVHTAGTGDFLWKGAVCGFLAVNEVPLTPGRQAPVPRPDEFESRPHLVTLHAAVKPRQMAVASLVPVRAQNRSGGPLLAQVTAYQPEKVRLTVWPNATSVAPLIDDYQVAVADNPAPVRLTLYDVADEEHYRVPPRSLHRVIITDLVAPLGDQPNKPVRTAPIVQVLTADGQGHLQIELTTSASMVEISGVQ
ncbi:MAG: hypothetical protein M3347_04255, partial [Armatimonadota bacterium]|nr:hypothetical protein [Armatimonadota bacterium]